MHVFRKIVAVILVLGLIMGQVPSGLAYDNLAASLVSDGDLDPARLTTVRNDIGHALEPDAIGNGTPLLDLIQEKLPDQLSSDETEHLFASDSTLRNSIDLAIRLCLEHREKIPFHYCQHVDDTLLNLYNFQNYLRNMLYLYNAVVYSPEDYLLGFNSRGRIGLSIELIDRLHSISPERLAQYVFRVSLDEKDLDMEKERRKAVFGEILADIFGKDEVFAFEADINEFINERYVEAHEAPPEDKRDHKTVLGVAIDEIREWKKQHHSIMNKPLNPSTMRTMLQEKAAKIYAHYKLERYTVQDRAAYALEIYDSKDSLTIHKAISEVASAIMKTGCLEGSRITPYGFHILSSIYSKLEVRGTIEQNNAIRFVVDTILFDFYDREKRTKELEWLIEEFGKELTEKGTGNIPLVCAISDLHGGAERTASLIGYGLGLDPDIDLSNVEELKAALAEKGIDPSIMDVRFIGLSDKYDRGRKPIETFEIARYLRDEIHKAKPITGNHDLWRALGVLGVYRLPFEGPIIKNDHIAHWSKEAFWHTGRGDIELDEINQSRINQIIHGINSQIERINSKKGHKIIPVKPILIDEYRASLMPKVDALKKINEKIRAENEAHKGETGYPKPSEDLPEVFEATVKFLMTEIEKRNRLIEEYNAQYEVSIDAIDYNPVIRENFMTDPDVIKRALWDLKTFRLIYIDVYGNSYLHGLVPFDESKGIIQVEYKGLKGFEAVEQIQVDIRKFFEKMETIPNSDEFRRKMWDELGEAFTEVNSWYSDLNPIAKPDFLQKFIRQGGPAGFGLGSEVQSIFSDRRATGILVLGHNERKKLKKSNMPWFDGRLLGGLMNIDFELSHGYRNMGSIVMIGKRDRDGNITGIRRYGYKSGDSREIEELTTDDLEGADDGAREEIDKLRDGDYFMRSYIEKAEEEILYNLEWLIMEAIERGDEIKAVDFRRQAEAFRDRIQARKEEKEIEAGWNWRLNESFRNLIREVLNRHELERVKKEDLHEFYKIMQSMPSSEKQAHLEEFLNALADIVAFKISVKKQQEAGVQEEKTNTGNNLIISSNSSLDITLVSSSDNNEIIIDDIDVEAGESSTNIMRALTAIKNRSTLVLPASRDMAGEYFMDLLGRTRDVEVVNADSRATPITLVMNFADEKTDLYVAPRERKLNNRDAVSFKKRAISAIDAVKEPHAVYFHTNLTSDSDPELLIDVMESALRKDAWVVYDSKAGVWQDKLFRQNLFSRAAPDILKLNLNEFYSAQDIDPSGVAYDEARLTSQLREFAEGYNLSIVLLSLGEKGVLVYANGILLRALAPEVSYLRGTGSGDMLLAAFVASLPDKSVPLTGDILETAIKRAVAAASLSLAKPDIDSVTSADIESAAQSVKVFEAEAYVETDTPREYLDSKVIDSIIPKDLNIRSQVRFLEERLDDVVDMCRRKIEILRPDIKNIAVDTDIVILFNRKGFVITYAYRGDDNEGCSEYMKIFTQEAEAFINNLHIAPLLIDFFRKMKLPVKRMDIFGPYEVTILDSSDIGEGQGQIFRAGIAFSILMNKPVLINNIRTKKKGKSGLLSSDVSAALCMDEVTYLESFGRFRGSTRVMVWPRNIRQAVNIHVDAETFTGKVNIPVSPSLQAIMPVLAFAHEKSTVMLRGGTQRRGGSLPVTHLQNIFLPFLKKMGYSALLEVSKMGWEGQGEVLLVTEPVEDKIKPLIVTDRAEEGAFRAEILYTGEQFKEVAMDSQRYLNARLEEFGLKNVPVEVRRVDGFNGDYEGALQIEIYCDFGNTIAGFSREIKERGNIRKGIHNVLSDLKQYLDSNAAIDRRTAEMLIPFMVLADGRSRIDVSNITESLLSVVQVMRQLVPEVIIEIIGEKGSPGTIIVDGIGYEYYQEFMPGSENEPYGSLSEGDSNGLASFYSLGYGGVSESRLDFLKEALEKVRQTINSGVYREAVKEINLIMTAAVELRRKKLVANIGGLDQLIQDLNTRIEHIMRKAIDKIQEVKKHNMESIKDRSKQAADITFIQDEALNAGQYFGIDRLGSWKKRMQYAKAVFDEHNFTHVFLGLLKMEEELSTIKDFDNFLPVNYIQTIYSITNRLSRNMAADEFEDFYFAVFNLVFCDVHINQAGAETYTEGEPDSFEPAGKHAQVGDEDGMIDGVRATETIEVKASGAEAVSEKEIEYRAEYFKAAIMRFLGKYPDRKFILAIDSDIGKEQKAQIMPVYRAIDQLKELVDNHGKGVLPNLLIIRESGDKLVSAIKEKTDTFSNVFLVAQNENFKKNIFDEFIGRAWISALDDTGADRFTYLPVFEAAILSIMAGLGADIESIKRFYDMLSDQPISMDRLKNLREERILYLLPKAIPINPDDLRGMYENVRTALISA